MKRLLIPLFILVLFLRPRIVASKESKIETLISSDGKMTAQKLSETFGVIESDQQSVQLENGQLLTQWVFTDQDSREIAVLSTSDNVWRASGFMSSDWKWIARCMTRLSLKDLQIFQSVFQHSQEVVYTQQDEWHYILRRTTIANKPYYYLWLTQEADLGNYLSQTAE